LIALESGKMLAKLVGTERIEIQMKTNMDEPEKQNDNPLICYCFGYTRNNLEQDFITNGKSLIMEKIMFEKKIGGCHCATNNPSGK
jgi:hypothetical protein